MAPIGFLFIYYFDLICTDITLPGGSKPGYTLEVYINVDREWASIPYTPYTGSSRCQPRICQELPCGLPLIWIPCHHFPHELNKHVFVLTLLQV